MRVHEGLATLAKFRTTWRVVLASELPVGLARAVAEPALWLAFPAAHPRFLLLPFIGVDFKGIL